MKSIYEQSYQVEPVYSIDISIDLITGKRRRIESPELSINSTSIYLQCTVFYLDGNGDKIISERLKSYQKRLSADNKESGPWVNPLNGERYEIVDNEVPDDAVLRYTFLKNIFNGNNPVHLKAMIESFVANADAEPYKEFDI